MKKIHLLVPVIFLLLGFDTDRNFNCFSSLTDTLLIYTEKYPGAGPFAFGYSRLIFVDTSKISDIRYKFPEKFNEIRFCDKVIDNKYLHFNDFKNGLIDTSTFIMISRINNIDTLNLPTPNNADNQIGIIKAKQGDSSIIIVDENNNKDFTDDPMRKISKFNRWSIQNLIPCKYKIYNDKYFVEDSSWLNIGIDDYNNIMWFVSQHLITSFIIDNKKYKIGIVDDTYKFTFDQPNLALIEENGIKKDTILYSDFIKRGEYIKLGEDYFLFSKISNDGRFITIIKEKHFETKIGTQVGLLAPSFECKTINGEIISNKDLNNKTILIANFSGCSPISYDMYKELYKTYRDKIYILGVESGINKNIGGKLIDVEMSFNKEFYNQYRQVYSSYICYLIDTNYRILDKFSIFDWKQKLRDRIK